MLESSKTISEVAPELELNAETLRSFSAPPRRRPPPRRRSLACSVNVLVLGSAWIWRTGGGGS
ncbi:hypothetical protein ACOT81_36530 [Streptomyces sp. WI04-05B]|uniref:hypothetical protein n=1 Tax=Streptomyces TaxID=1883 RepID=UPI0039F52F06